MPSQEDLDRRYMKMAKISAESSKASRKKVGAIIVKDNKIISEGYNGTPTGMDNNCENDEGDTFWYVLHAESNAIAKLAYHGGVGCKNSTLYCTVSPCKNCSKLIIQSGIIRVVYLEKYRDLDGIEFLKEYGISVLQISI